jgi:hypothetical protein
MKKNNFVVFTIRVLRWLILTLLYAVLAPWLLFACLLCLLSFLPQEVWSFRELVTDAAFANAEAWRSGALTWHDFTRICFVLVCGARGLRSSVLRELGSRIEARLTTWIDSRVSPHRQRQVGRIGFVALMASCIVLGIAASKTDRPKRFDPITRSPSVSNQQSAAALRLSTGRILSGGAVVTPAETSGQFWVRFQNTPSVRKEQ